MTFSTEDTDALPFGFMTYPAAAGEDMTYLLSEFNKPHRGHKILAAALIDAEKLFYVVILYPMGDEDDAPRPAPFANKGHDAVLDLPVVTELYKVWRDNGEFVAELSNDMVLQQVTWREAQMELGLLN